MSVSMRMSSISGTTEPAASAGPPPARVKEAAPRSLQLLLLCDFPKTTASTIIDHIFGLEELSAHSITVFNSKGDGAAIIDLDRFDGVIIHYSLVACMDTYVGPNLRAAIRRFSGLKAAFVQDDYRWINDTVDAMRDLGIHILFGLVPPETIDQVYAPERLPGVLRETVLTGYVPLELTKRTVPPLDQRPLDVGYRARKVPAWLGSFAQEKWWISKRFEKDAAQYGLTCDFSNREKDRLYGEQWIEFLSSCKAVLGTESGASVCDFTGEIQRKVDAHVAAHPDADFETLRDLYFKEEDGRIAIPVISPRCFEAAALRTLMILYEGHYSGRLTAWRHYVPLKKDHSNMAEVVEVLRDQERAQAIVDRAFQEVALSPENSFAAMVRQVDDAINRMFRHEMAAKKAPYSKGDIVALAKWDRRRRVIRRFGDVFWKSLLYVRRPRGLVRKLYAITRRRIKLTTVRWSHPSFIPKGPRRGLKNRVIALWPKMLDF
ncbi:hypothetical protein JQ615_38055 [Bradyrhizobium jicamae]|uniref:Glycosyltransferase 2-like domain-containing protein n=1 Tax=Bradyrhizobium jicamae TaxID=280332 RepID=A0ABS5FWP4_9BRAD|nr:hypothetical protein [Bradyrhizobium jicamae]MBR0801173.1 hypothetical protein [Bradyrhizobium jicamae]